MLRSAMMMRQQMKYFANKRLELLTLRWNFKNQHWNFNFIFMKTPGSNEYDKKIDKIKTLPTYATC